jgi:hypothetical protein
MPPVAFGGRRYMMDWLRGKWFVIGPILGVLIGFVLALLAMAAGWFEPRPGPQSSTWGSFPAKPKVELEDDGRDLRLLEDFVYIDSRGKVWSAQKDLIVDGASIPRLFWTITGGPLEGEYRNASIVHDAGCDRMTEPWEEVHAMFYEACRCGGVSDNKAKVLYAAVYHFGPRWVVKTVSEVKTVIGPDGKQHQTTVKRHVSNRLQTAEPNADFLDKLQKFVNEKNPSLEDLRKVDPKDL